ncbi:MAG: hypothetical protein CMH60_02365 [Myxococcales bacterium]|nr:hypothetical protein [Myxococcales bacterium]
MLKNFYVPIFCLFGLVANTAHALCPSGQLTHSLGVRVEDSLLPLVQQPILDLLPESMAVPEEPVTLMECSGLFEDTIITPRDGDISFELSSPQVDFEEDQVRVRFYVDVAAESDLDMQLCALPDASCAATLSAQDIFVEALLEPQITDCEAEFPFRLLDIQVDPEKTDVNLSSCGLYDNVFNLTYDYFSELMINLAVGKIEEKVQELLPEFIESFSNGILSNDIELYNIKFGARPQTVMVKENVMEIIFQASAEATSTGACLLPGSTLSAANAQPVAFTYSNSMLGVAASRYFIQEVLGAAWMSGWMCFDSRDWGLDLSEPLQGFLPGSSIAGNVNAMTPPQLFLNQAGKEDVRLVLPALDAAIEVDLGGNNPFTVQANTGADVSVALQIDPSLQALVLEPLSIETEALVVDLPKDGLIFSESAMAGLMQNFLLPSFVDTLKGLPLMPSIFVGAPIALSAEDVHIDSEYVQADVQVYPLDANDMEPPMTALLNVPPHPSPRRVELSMNSADNYTPADFLRHRIWVDGEEQSESFYGKNLLLSSLDGGWHNISLAAIDLNGNEDASPVALLVLVDGEAPEIDIVSAPVGIWDSTEAVLEYSIKDDHSSAENLEVTYTLGQITREALPDIPLEEGRIKASGVLSFQGLPEDAIVRITIRAEDEAGNIGEAEAVFAVNAEPTMGCQSTQGNSLNLLWLLLFGIFCLLRRPENSVTNH